MKRCYCYDFTKPSRRSYQGCKLFRVQVEDFEDFDSFCIRSVIDGGSEEFRLRLKEFDERSEDIETDKAWFKLMHLLFGFRGEYDVKKKIAYDIKRHLEYYPDYAEKAKKQLSRYIELLRTGKYYNCRYNNLKFYKDMSVDNLVDLLEEELLLRAIIYQNPRSQKVIIEISDYYYDYSALCEKYGIVDPDDTTSDSYKDFIAYITTSEETEHLKSLQVMYAQMWGE